MEPINHKKIAIITLILIVGPGVIWFVLFNVIDTFIYEYQHYSGPCYTYDGSKPPPPISPFHWQETGLITFWFDDAWFSTFSNAAPLMEEMGYKGALAVAIKFICKPKFMTWNNVYDLQSKGWEISSHSTNHVCKIEYYNKNAIEEEVLLSKQILRKHGLSANTFVMPCGYSLFDLKQYFFVDEPPFFEGIKKYYTAYRTTEGVELNSLPVSNPYYLNAFEVRNSTSNEEIANLIQEAIKKKQWLILVFHQVGEDNHLVFNVGLAQFKNMLTLVKNSQLPVVLPTQAIGVQKPH